MISPYVLFVDIIAIVAICVFQIPKHTDLNIIYSLLIGIAIGFIYLWFSLKRFVNVLMCLAISFIYAYYVPAVVSHFFSLNTVWNWIVHIVFFLVTLLIHYYIFDVSLPDDLTLSIPYSKRCIDLETNLYYPMLREIRLKRNTAIKEYNSLVSQGKCDTKMQSQIVSLDKEYQSVIDETEAMWNKHFISFKKRYWIATKNLQKLKEIVSKQSALVQECNTSYRKKEKQKDNTRNVDNNEITDFFIGCSSMDAIRKRYKALCKSFHPDLGFGDEKTMQIINHQYEQLSRRYK